MTYKEIAKNGRLLHEYDKSGQGPYQDVYQGTVEWWAVGNNIYRHETNNNSLAYTGTPSDTEYVGKARDIDILAAALANCETQDDESALYADIMMGKLWPTVTIWQ